MRLGDPAERLHRRNGHRSRLGAEKAPGGQPGLADLQPQCRGGGVVLLRLRLPVRAGDPVPDLLLSQLQHQRHHFEGRQIRHEIRGGHPAAGGALPAAHAAAAPRCHCAPGGGNVLGDSPFPADLRGEPPSGGSVPGD
ncbi:DNA-directed RNA polymerase specialized sigma subunit, sigma24 family, partial [Dysosmobacter welbionis]